ncbi:MAG TPA: hypothetical protein VFY93_10935 [Planctomycetota bacterium]|nr:hypothetical protein [Planctomycetota bacterium]
MAPRTPLLLLLLAACQGAPPPAPAGPASSVVAIALITRADRPPHEGRPRTAYFVKLAAEGTQPILLRSDYERDGVLYLVNAQPGRYAAVACYGKGETNDWTAYFPESLIRATEKEVPEGRVVLLGSFRVDLRSISTPGDATQQHYLNLIFPEWAKRSEAWKLFTRDQHAWGGPWLAADDAADVLLRMRKRLGPAWAAGFE